MYKVQFDAYLDKNLINNFKRDIRHDVIENGIDAALEKDLEKYKKELLWAINSRNPNVREQDKQILTEEGLEPTVILPKSDEDILKKLTGIDISKIRGTKDYTSSVESNVVVSNDFRLKLRLPLSPFETFEENYEKAKQFFNKSIFVFGTGAGRTKYLYNPGIDISQYVKVVCSTDVGDTGRSRQVFESYKDSNNRPRQASSEIGRYAEWSLKQEGVQRILQSNSGFIDLTEVINKIKEGNLQDAELLLRDKKLGNKGEELTQKLDDIKKEVNLNPDMEAYAKIVKLVGSMELDKKITPEKVIYSLVVDQPDGEVSRTFDDLYTYVLKDVSLWIGYSSPDWIKTLEDIINKLITRYQNAANPTKV
jgi:hypothetical protein